MFFECAAFRVLQLVLFVMPRAVTPATNLTQALGKLRQTVVLNGIDNDVCFLLRTSSEVSSQMKPVEPRLNSQDDLLGRTIYQPAMSIDTA
jgi:hypothetical protein